MQYLIEYAYQRVKPNKYTKWYIYLQVIEIISVNTDNVWLLTNSSCYMNLATGACFRPIFILLCEVFSLLEPFRTLIGLKHQPFYFLLVEHTFIIPSAVEQRPSSHTVINQPDGWWWKTINYNIHITLYGFIVCYVMYQIQCRTPGGLYL